MAGGRRDDDLVWSIVEAIVDHVDMPAGHFAGVVASCAGTAAIGVASAVIPKSLDVCAAQAAPRCVLVVAHRTPLWDSSSALRCIHLDDAYCQGTSNARH